MPARVPAPARRIELSDLPRWSPWPARLLGLAPWEPEPRTVKKIEREYDRDKFGALLRAVVENPALTPDDLRVREYGIPPSQAMCISLGNELFEVTLAEALRLYQGLIQEAVGARAGSCRTVVELGAGYGFNLGLLHSGLAGKTLLGGELSANGRALAERLYQDRLRLLPFNFYERESYAILEAAEPPILILTVGAIDSLPRMGSVLDCLTAYRHRVAAVVHFEPTYELHETDLLGLMCRRYAEVNDYNTDLVSQLRSRSAEVRILRMDRDAIGLNPLHPHSIIEWEFT